MTMKDADEIAELLAHKALVSSLTFPPAPLRFTFEDFSKLGDCHPLGPNQKTLIEQALRDIGYHLISNGLTMFLVADDWLHKNSIFTDLQGLQ